MVLEVEKKSSSANICADFIVSVGNACRPAHYLRKHNLRPCSNPFDWMMNYSLDAVIELFKTDFEDFFKFKKDYPELVIKNYRYVQDTKTGMTSIHSFPTNKNLDFEYIHFFKTMKTRYLRMKECMQHSENILFVSNRNEPIQNFENFLLEMSQIFNANFTYLNIKTDETINEIQEFEISKNLKIIQHVFDDTHSDGNQSSNPNFWHGNSEKWEEVMGRIHLTNNLSRILSCDVSIEDRILK